MNLSKPLVKIEFAVPNLVPKGYLSFVGAREGVGKTMLLTGLLWQMSRPDGGDWLGMPVRSGSSIFVNTDAPDGESRAVRYWLEKHRTTFPDGDISRVTVLEPEEGGLSPSDMDKIKQLILESGASVVVIDSFMGAFVGFDSNRLEKIMGCLKALVNLAAETGVALIVTDHLPKRAAGEKDGDRGIMGSIGKSAQSRAVILLTRIPLSECQGENVVKVDVTKQAFSKRLETFAVSIRVEDDENIETSKVYFDPYDLPDQRTDSGKYRAKQAVKRKLETQEWVAHAELVDIAKRSGDLQERQARTAVQEATEEAKPRLEERKKETRGAPKEYRLKPVFVDLNTKLSKCHKSEKNVSDDLDLVA